MEYTDLVRARYSCRAFDGSRAVEPEKLAAVVEAARVAPTAVNRQPFHVWRISSEEARAAVEGNCRFTFGAPEFLLVGAKADEAWTRRYDSANFACVDASIAATQMMLAASDLGLGSTWVACFDAPALQAALPETAGYDLVALFPIGYPAPDAAPAEQHGRRKAVDELYSEL
ncbi:nitroreductase [Coriobacteriaceae bacterium]|nr:nitroreductase [Coriobacteriaceae bacterium]